MQLLIGNMEFSHRAICRKLSKVVNTIMASLDSASGEGQPVDYSVGAALTAMEIQSETNNIVSEVCENNTNVITGFDANVNVDIPPEYHNKFSSDECDDTDYETCEYEFDAVNDYNSEYDVKG